MQKSVRTHRDYDVLAGPLHFDPVHVAHRRACLTFRSSERREVVLTHQVSSSRLHSSFIEWIPNPAHAISLDRRPRPAVQDDVAIGSRERAVAGMEGVRDIASPE